MAITGNMPALATGKTRARLASPSAAAAASGCPVGRKCIIAYTSHRLGALLLAQNHRMALPFVTRRVKPAGGVKFDDRDNWGVLNQEGALSSADPLFSYQRTQAEGTSFEAWQ